MQLANVNTGVIRTTTTNNDGAYDFPSVAPGGYGMQASADGFAAVSQPPVTLEVSQIATFNFQLTIGAATSNVTVTAAPAAMQTSSSELGTVVSTAEVNNLPLNGRNFTQLLTITAGVANINTDQNSGGGGGWNGKTIGTTDIPAVNGARNRSNMFILDSANDLNTLSGVYNYAPIVDAIQEFKTQDHNDLAEYGGAAGGAVTVVTKGGTNQYHGAVWEFLRNEQMDARGYFEANRTPLRQNQYGASAGGPISIPKLYDGRNRTFFYLAWEGYRYASAQETGALGPTDAMRNGDFSALGTPIYDPATTVLDPATGAYTRQTFTQEYNEPNPAYCGGDINCIPASRINPVSALYQSAIPQSGALVNGSNVFVSGSSWTNQDSGTIRADHSFGNSDQLMFRYSQFGQFGISPSGTIGAGFDQVAGHNYIGHWTHTYSPTAFSDVYFGRNYGYSLIGTSWPGQGAGFTGKLQALGVSTSWMTLDGKLYPPQFSADNYVGFTGSQLQGSGLADNWQFGGSFTKIVGKHTFKAGGDFETNNFVSPIAYAGSNFGVAQTGGLGADQGVGGNSWASLLLGIPREASYRNVNEVVHGGWIDAFFLQDQFKATSRLTINIGFRNDMVFTPIYGTGNGGNFYTGEANPVTGQYILNALPPNCSATQGAPCIPNGIYTSSTTPAPGGLPPNAIVRSNPRMINNSLADWAIRLGGAYRLNDKTTIRGGYGRQYDLWATIIQLSQNFAGNWPAVNTIDNAGLNNNIPTVNTADPLGLGGGGALIYPINDFSQVSQWMVDPNFKTPYLDQWNIGVERQLPANIALDANYVGSVGRHLDWGPTMNTPQPGPGTVQARRPYPYMLQQWFDQSAGDSRYNALQITVNKRTSHGVTFLAAYTLGHSNDDGCGLGASCNSSNPYNRAADYGTSDLNQKHAFSAAFTAQSPFTRSPNRWVSNFAGGWALSGIVQFSSGQPYTVTTGSDPENIGCCLQERLNVVGNPNSGPGIRTREQWFNTSAFVTPAPYTYGTEKVNPYTAQMRHEVDLSVLRQFHVGLGEQRFFEFRVDSFNLFNNVVFNTPDATISDTTFGQIKTQQNSPRQLQVALKFYY
ncbi:Oar protein [Acidisarcina polymorpha]|uniref:Oar protein n=1 Tax=Acidisarcina polymorpha TaxID=2211140 RepID=A0A2Z5FSC6_9BACT|nr:Oar protein [Acidisarcina polymorpha]